MEKIKFNTESLGPTTIFVPHDRKRLHKTLMTKKVADFSSVQDKRKINTSNNIFLNRFPSEYPQTSE